MSTIAAARPLVSVRNFETSAVAGQVALPSVFLSPIRSDIVHFVHSNMAKNKRQPYAVSAGAGHQHSAESWGTGRAVARVPRVSGGGTSRSGQGAFANSCRKGRMFAPTKIWRKWHRKINTNQKRFAVASALAASALPSLVLARGHKVENIPEIPLVLDNSVESLKKTKQAVAALTQIGALADVEKVKDSKKLRAGKGKLRNRRFVQRRGPLVVYNEDNGVVNAFRNLPGVELSHVDSLNLLQLAPGGHLGRFIIWTKGAFEKLNGNWGSVNRESTQKKGYYLPRPIVTNSDITRIINSDEIQSKVRAARTPASVPKQKKNPLTNFGALVKLNPYAVASRRFELLASERRAAEKASGVALRRSKKIAALAKKHEATQTKNYNRLVNDQLFPLAKDATVKETVIIPAVALTSKKARKEKAAAAAEEEPAAAAPAKDAKAPAKAAAKAPAKDAKAPAKDAKAPAKAAPKK